MTALYRKDYPGEFVITSTTWSKGRKQQTREWVDNPIQNQHLSHRAAAIGSNIHKDLFDYTVLQNHRGGIKGSKKLQTYGVATVAQEMRVDFAVSTDLTDIQPLIDNKYAQDGIVYTTAKNCLIDPGQFYLIPTSPRYDTVVLPVFLAAFDGHQDVFLIGYCNDTPAKSTAWQQQIAQIMTDYAGTRFTVVGPETNIPQMWLDRPNCRTYTYNEFVSYCDV